LEASFHIGVFQDPLRVFLDPSFFNTLPAEEVRSGFAEIIKHCLIRDASMFQEIQNASYNQLDLAALTKHSVEIKGDVVGEDPTEKGLRKILNFGHTIGHAIESYFLDQPGKKLLHGEAIAIGMICEAYLSVQKLGMQADSLNDISSYILGIYHSSKIDPEDINEIIALTAQDKKNEGDIIKCSLLNKIGDCAFNIDINHQDIKASIEYFNRVTR
jgi:3-dehydroquinate synthase